MVPVVFINCKKVPYIDKIIGMEKTYETRNRNTLRSLVGRRVLIAETGKGTPKIRCSAIIDAPLIVDDRQSWDNFKSETCVPDGSEHDWGENTQCKWLYRLIDVREVCDLHWKEGKRHGITWMEYEPAPYRMIYDGDSFIGGEDHDSFESAIGSAEDTLIMWSQEEWSEKKWQWDDEHSCYHPTEEQIDAWDYMIYNMGCYVVAFNNETGEYDDLDDAVWPRSQEDLDKLGWMLWEDFEKKYATQKEDI